MSCSGSLKKGRFGYQWQAALALVGPIYDTSVESTIFAGNPFCLDGCFKNTIEALFLFPSCCKYMMPELLHYFEVTWEFGEVWVVIYMMKDIGHIHGMVMCYVTDDPFCLLLL